MITNEQRDALLEYYDATGILKKEIRSYEVSLWTLQDEFITVLKWSDSEQKGRIESPTMTLNVDGTQSFECSIPMYIWANGKLVENPNWYNTYNNNIIVDLRKIKVILNKMTDDEEVFEFVIDEVTESHEKDILTCNIKCSGLAFHELGKVGYKINLSEDTFYEVYKAWEDDENRIAANEPIENIDFWMGENGVGLECANNNLKSTQWYYKVEMDWKSFANDGASARLATKIYEEPYTSNWNASLLPTATESYTEKQRPITVENSNIYNITLTVAETFLVYCRYEYGYDENYHIISRTIIFYNNFMKENDVLSLTYPYSSSKVSRTMDSADLTTKLFVLDVDNLNNLEGYNSIMNSPANKTKEGYILNFDYLYKTKGITELQYQDLKIFERKIREKNEAIIPLQNLLNKLYNLKPEIEGKKTFYENSADAAQDLIDTNSALKNALTANNGSNNETITVDESHPDLLAVREGDDNVKYVNLTYTNKGIRSKTVKVYTDYHSLAASGSKLINADEITNFTFEYDEYNNPTTLKFGLTVTASMVYLTYEYEPQLYYDSVVKVWKDKMAYDTIKAQEYADLLDDLEDEIEDYEEDLEDLYTEKKELIAAFEHMMGPALREGYWQPEDYKDYGSKFNVSKTFPAAAESDDDYALIWDNELFDEEQNIYYELGIDLAKKYYPCINLGAVFNNNIPSNIEEYSFIFNNNYSLYTPTEMLNSEKQKWVLTFKIKGGGLAKLAYIRKNSIIYPVLLLVGAKTMTDEEVGFMKDAAKGHPTLGIYTTTVSGSSIISNITNSVTFTNAHWITLNNTYEIVYPRIQFTSLDYDGNNTMVYYNGELLTRYKDYLPLTRINNSGVLESIITIKPEVMYKALTNTGLTEVHYTISNANTQIYLDAMAVSKENAWPKVSYEVTPSIFSKETMRTLYKRLAQLVTINDVLLKFDNVFGYISGMTLDLDNPQNDTLEIKNYKTKFEDLFSNIVALTESMKTNESLFAAAIRGEIPLATSALETVLTTNVSTFNIMLEYLDSYFDSSEVVLKKLTELFTEAGEILSDSNKSLNLMRSLSTLNASILAGFARNVTEELSVKVVKSLYKPLSFKVGDIWILTDAQGNEIGRYVATYNSLDVNGDTGNANSGFVRTYDGTLSSITGAGMTVDTVLGLVDIYGAHEIKLRSGEHVYISAGDTVDIVGNREVNIGGTTINIAAASTSGTVGSVGGINIVATHYTTNNMSTAIASKVLIHPEEIKLAGSKITLLTGTASGATSAILIDGTNDPTIPGIWLGSSKSIKLFSGTTVGGANVDISPTHILFGVANTTSNTTAAELTDKYIIFAAGDTLTSLDGDNENITIDGSIVGVKITKESIGMAAGSGNNRSAILMNSTGVKIGAGTTATTSGSYISLGGSGIEFGSLADLYINTNNFKLLTHSRDKNVSGSSFIDGETIMAIGNNLLNVDYYTMIYDTENNTWKKKNSDGTLSNITFTNGAPTVRLLVNKNGLYINGTVYASAGSFTGSVTSNEFVAIGSTGRFIANGSGFGLYTNDTTPAGILTFTSGKMSIASNYTIEAGGGLSIAINQNFKVRSGGVIIDTAATGTLANPGVIFSVSGDNGSLTLDTNGDLTISGNITAANSTFSGTVTSSLFKAIGSNGLFIADSNSFGLYTLGNSPSPILTFSTDANNTTYMDISGNYVIKASGGITIDADKDFIMSANNGCFIIDSSIPKLYIANNADWGLAEKGIQYTANGGLEIKGNISANSITTGTLSGIDLDIGNTNGQHLTYNTLTAALTINGHIEAATGTIGPFTITSDGFKVTGNNNALLKYDTTNSVFLLSLGNSMIRATSSYCDLLNAPNSVMVRAANSGTYGVQIMGVSGGCYMVGSGTASLTIESTAWELGDSSGAYVGYLTGVLGSLGLLSLVNTTGNVLVAGTQTVTISLYNSYPNSMSFVFDSTSISSLNELLTYHIISIGSGSITFSGANNETAQFTVAELNLLKALISNEYSET